MDFKQIEDLLNDLSLIYENKQIEIKSAKDGFPRSFWETYSSFANTDGGVIIFGVKEKQEKFFFNGLTRQDVEKHKKDFFSTQKNSNQVNIPLLTDDDVQELEIEDNLILVFRIPRATREQRPVFLGKDPYKGTYRRTNEGDFLENYDTVNNLLCDKQRRPHDSRILKNYSWEDIDEISFRQFRTMFANLQPTHPWTSEDDLGLLKKLGGYRKDRATGEEGFTVGGMLMFGKTESISDPECIPDFMIDYRDVPADTTTTRWIDRLYPDGTWNANLFQFYRLVLPKLQQAISKPFILKGDTRIDENPTMVALREALINCLVHASYGASARIVVEKHPSQITMSNPGTLMISKEQYYEGGRSECRNPSLQKMFGLIGRSDKAGSGVDKIMKGWKFANWRRPNIEETVHPDKVELFLPLESIISNAVLRILENQFGSKVKDLEPEKLLILSNIVVERRVSNQSLQSLLDLHPSEISKTLKELCNEGYLNPKGYGRGTIYELSSADASSDYSTLDDTGADTMKSRGLRGHGLTWDNLGHVIPTSNDVTSSDASSDVLSSDVLTSGVLTSDVLTSDTPTSQVQGSSITSEEIRMIKRHVQQWKTIREISYAIGRPKEQTRRRIISKLLKQGYVEMEFPETPNHPHQRYRIKR